MTTVNMDKAELSIALDRSEFVFGNIIINVFHIGVVNRLICLVNGVCIEVGGAHISNRILCHEGQAGA